MTFLLDTNVIAEWVKPRPDTNVIAWLADVDEDRVFVSVASFAEIRHGIERLPEGRRRQSLSAWLSEDLPQRFEGRILHIDRHIAEVCGVMMARGWRAGMTVGSMDGFIAATAAAHGHTLVTRNTRDFAPLRITLFDPWERRAGR